MWHLKFSTSLPLVKNLNVTYVTFKITLTYVTFSPKMTLFIIRHNTIQKHVPTTYHPPTNYLSITNHLFRTNICCFSALEWFLVPRNRLFAPRKITLTYVRVKLWLGGYSNSTHCAMHLTCVWKNVVSEWCEWICDMSPWIGTRWLIINSWSCMFLYGRYSEGGSTTNNCKTHVPKSIPISISRNRYYNINGMVVRY